MEKWLRISLILCVFGCLKELRPSESFIVNFLTGPERNFTREQINIEIVPLEIYSYAAMLILVLLLTDLLRYKPIIIVGALCNTILTSLYIWTTSIESLKIIQYLLGVFMASEVAYYSYIYAKVDKEHYPKVTSHTRAALLCGKLTGGIIGQLLLYFKIMAEKQLLLITLSSQVAATVWAFFLPNIKTSLYFHRTQDNKIENGTIEKTENSQEIPKTLTAFKLIWSHFKNAYTNIKIIQYSIWYSFGVCGCLQVLFNIQILWSSLKIGDEADYNGAVDGIFTFFAALASILAGYLQSGRLAARENVLLIGILSVLQGLSILLGAWTQNLMVAYTSYIVFRILYAFTITIVSSQIAQSLAEDSFGLVFGFNTLIAVLLEVLLTVIIIRPGGLALDLKGQFTFYAFYYVIMGVIYAGLYIFEVYLDKRKRSHCCERL